MTNDVRTIPTPKSAPPGKPPKETEISESAERLLSAASDLLAGRNTIDISLSEVSAKSGLNSSLIKYYFGNKEGLLLALIRRDAERSIAVLDKLVESNFSPADKIQKHIYGIINTYSKYPYMNRLIHYLLSDSSSEAAHQVAEFFVLPLVQAEEKILRQGFEAGVFRDIHPFDFYYSIVGACDQVFFARASHYVFQVKELDAGRLQRYAAAVTEMALRFLAPSFESAKVAAAQ